MKSSEQLHRSVIIYSGPNCHLCDEAMTLLQQLEFENPVMIEMVDIIESDDLVNTYGERIPVLKRLRDGVELGWPFTIEELPAFFADV